MSNTSPKQPPRWRAILKKVVIVLAALLGVILAALLLLGLFPIRVETPVTAGPAGSFAETRNAIAAIQQAELANPDFNPVCETIVMDHGEPTESVFVLFHGFTSCPEQYRALGEQLFEMGHNVYIPLQPYHGLTDRRGNALNDLTAAELAAFTSESVDIASGMGEQIVVSGISGGGALAAWAAQERDDVARAVPMAPFIGIKLVPGVFLNKGFTNLIQILPNFYRWWDPIAKENNPASAPYSYVGYPFRSMGAYMRLGFSALGDAGDEPPAGSVVMVLNPHETSISNAVGKRFVQEWQTAGGRAELAELPAELNLAHDFISVTRPGNNPEVIYPILLPLLTGDGS